MGTTGDVIALAIGTVSTGAAFVATTELKLISLTTAVSTTGLAIGLTGAIALTALFTGGGPPDTGWTFYVPYSIRTGTNVLPAMIAAFILGFSSILTGLNFVTTIHRMRAPGMG